MNNMVKENKYQATVVIELKYVLNFLSVMYTRWGNLPEDSCAVSEIRVLITMARQERATADAAGCPPPYNPHAATAPPPTEEYKRDMNNHYASSPEASPSCEFDCRAGLITMRSLRLPTKYAQDNARCGYRTCIPI